MEQKETKEQPVIDPFIFHLKNYLLSNYKPVSIIQEAELHLSTQDIYEKLQAVYPSLSYSPEDVANWLLAAGFRFTDFGNMKFEWLLTNV